MSTNQDGPARRRGRPLSATVEQSVFDETLRLVAETTPDALTRRAIADGAGVSRQTLYNRWPTTADILLDALLERASHTIGIGERTDIRSYLGDLAGAVNGWARPALRAVVTFAQSDPRFARRFHDEFLATRHRALTAAVTTSSSDPSRSDLDAELIAASMWYRVLIVDAELDARWVDDMTRLVIADAERRPAQ